MTCSASQPQKTKSRKGGCCSLLKIRGNLHSQIDYYGIYLMNGKSYDLVHAFNEKTSPDHHPKEQFIRQLFLWTMSQSPLNYLKTIANKNGRFVSENKKNQYERGFTSGRKPDACPENLKWWSWTYHWSRDDDFQVQCVEGKIFALDGAQTQP